jgi:hypothetical protein
MRKYKWIPRIIKTIRIPFYPKYFRNTTYFTLYKMIFYLHNHPRFFFTGNRPVGQTGWPKRKKKPSTTTSKVLKSLLTFSDCSLSVCSCTVTYRAFHLLLWSESEAFGISQPSITRHPTRHPRRHNRSLTF